MRIIRKDEAIHTSKIEGVDVNYYLFDEYEIHIDTQKPKTVQTWHSHQQIHETIIIIQGELIFRWVENRVKRETRVKSGDVIETGKTFHTLENATNQPVHFIAIKQVLSGKNKRNLFKTDKNLEQ